MAKISKSWYDKEVFTATWIKNAYEYLTKTGRLNHEGIYHLTRLTWITMNNKGEVTNGKYELYTKPSLSYIYNINPRDDFDKVLSDKSDISLSLNSPRRVGFTNLYRAYRNSFEKWVKVNEEGLIEIFNFAYKLRSDGNAKELFEKVLRLPGIPTPQNKRYMDAYCVLTPVLACLDTRLKFPIINGAEGVKALIKKYKLSANPLAQFKFMVELMHKEKCDALFLDVVCGSNIESLGTKKSQHI